MTADTETSSARLDRATLRQRLGRVGLWSMELRFGDPIEAAETASELDELGYGGLWFPGGVGGDVFGDLDRLLAATRRSIIATGIINIWKHEPAEVVGWWQQQPDAIRARALLGLGISHAPLIGDRYGKPVSTMRRYVEQLAELGVAPSSLCLAALGPKMLELSRDLTAGAHPYLVSPRHSATARQTLGPDALLAPEQGVVMTRDPDVARQAARTALLHYRQLPNYVNNWKRLGFSDQEIADESPVLLDALFAWGDVDAIARRVHEHLDAGADHVCLQIIAPDGGRTDAATLRSHCRALAAVLPLGPG